MTKLPSSRGCIVCGRENPIGLHVQFESSGEGVAASVQPGEHFQGFDGVLQGGIAAGLMDDAIWYAIFHATGTMTMTAELTVRYKAPVPVAEPLHISGRLLSQKRMLFMGSAAIADASGKVLAEATGKFLPAPAHVVESARR